MIGFRTVRLSVFKNVLEQKDPTAIETKDLTASERKDRALIGNAPNAMPPRLATHGAQVMPLKPMIVAEMHHAHKPIVRQTIANVPSAVPHLLQLKDAEMAKACAHKTLHVRKPALTTALLAEARNAPATFRMIVHPTVEVRRHVYNNEVLSVTVPPGCKAVDKVHAEMVLSSFARTAPDPVHVRPLAPEAHADRSRHALKHSAPCRHTVSARCSEEP